MDDQGQRWNGNAGFCRVSMRLLDLVGPSGKVTWCPGPDSNRYGVSPEGFSYPLQFSLLHAAKRAFGVWTLPSPWPATVPCARYRQGPSSLYTFTTPYLRAQRLARYCSHPDVLLFHRI